MHVTVHDVARLANVSISTVSRVLNGSARVNDDKKIRVEEAVKALGYIPNPAAQSLVGHKTGTIGALLPHITGEFFAELLSGLDAGAQMQENLLLVSASHRHASQFSDALLSLQRRVDGLVIMAPELNAEDVLAMINPELPVVFINTRSSDSDAHTFNFDNYGGMLAMTRHIIEAGHDHIAFVRGSDGAHDGQDRLRGFRDALSDNIRPVEVDGDFSAEGGYEAASTILRIAPKTTAILAANDLSAMGVLRALLKHGVNLPGDMSVTGFDDIPSARFAMPSLSTVHVPIRQLTIQAVRHLAGLIDGPAPSAQHMQQLDLSIRESSTSNFKPASLKTFS